MSELIKLSIDIGYTVIYASIILLLICLMLSVRDYVNAKKSRK
jgi:hypothetical protein